MRIREFVFGQKYSEWLEKHPDITVLGMAWAMLWRGIVVFYGAMFILGVFFAGLVSIFG